MKKLGAFLIPIVMVLGFSLLSAQMFSSGSVNPLFLGAIAVVLLIMMISFRSKSAPAKSAEAVAQELLDDFSKDAFADNEELKKTFYSALDNYGKNMPKAALSKLEKLEPQCSGDKEVYAVSLLKAKVLCTLQKYPNAIRAYNKAVVLNPTCAVASAMGDCYQRLGKLEKARDSYEFAIELDPKNTDALSRLATTYVADWDYEKALDCAMQVLELDEKASSALATAAICYGMLNDPVMSKQYTRLAVENGYSEKKITDTIDALKKRSK